MELLSICFSPSRINSTVLLLGCLIIFGCQKEPHSTTNSAQNGNAFAENFSIETYSDYQLLTVRDAFEGSQDSFQYVLYENEKPADYPNATFIKLPIKKAVCMSTTHLAMLQALGESNSVVAVAGQIYDNALAKKVKEGRIKNLGDGTGLNYELLIDLEPDVVFTFGVSDAASFQKIKTLGLKPVIISEFRDVSPMARAEWLRFFAAFYKKENVADSLFSAITTNYNEIKDLAQKVEKQPTVFTGVPFQGTWYVPSGESFVAQFIADAGGNYLWKDKKGSMSLTLDFEAVFGKAFDADKWLDVGYVFSKNDVLKMDKRFGQFKAFGANEMYNYTAKVSESGSFDIYESAVVRPDLVLRDFVKALHPSLIKEDFVYYERFE
jgi:iron complex transport system substrate-binding protein